MTPKQEARLLRARAATLRAAADEGLAPAYEARVEATENDKVAAELEAQAEPPTERTWCASCGMTRVEHELHTPGACRGFTTVTTP